MSDKKKVELWHLREWRSGNDTVDRAVYELFQFNPGAGPPDKTRKRACQRLIKIGEAAVPTILNALIKENMSSAGFAFFSGYCERNILPVRTLGDIGSPLAFPVLRKIYKFARREKMTHSCMDAHRTLCRALEDALRRCDHRWWKRLWRKLFSHGP